MRLLLPPSEGKTPGGRGAPLEPGRFGAEPLAERRRGMCAAVAALAAGPADLAASALRLPPATVDAALRADRVVSTSRTRRALDRYAGVVYDGLAVASMSPDQRRVANRSVLIFSGLFGVLTAAEPVPDYRVPAAAVLPGIGPLTGYWRPVLVGVMPELIGRRGLVVDLRSSDYAAMWRPRPSEAARVVVVRMLSRKPDGSLGIVSYNSKLAKGRLAAALIAHVAERGRVRTSSDVAAVWQATGGGTVLDADTPGRLDLRTD